MKSVLVIGSINIDIVAVPYKEIVLYDKNPGKAKFSYGGVGRNICENLARLEVSPTFLTIVGNDNFGTSAVDYLKNLGTNVIFKKSTLPTNTFISFLDHNYDNYLAVSSMDMIDEFDRTLVNLVNLNDYDLVVCDANSKAVIEYLSTTSCKLFIDATSVARVENIRDYISAIDYLKCTDEEFKTLFTNTSLTTVIERYPNLTLIITNKEQSINYNLGSTTYTKDVDVVPVVNAIGAGDSFSAGIVYGLLNNFDLHTCIERAMMVARHTVTCEQTVSEKLSKKIIGE